MCLLGSQYASLGVANVPISVTNVPYDVTNVPSNVANVPCYQCAHYVANIPLVSPMCLWMLQMFLVQVANVPMHLSLSLSLSGLGILQAVGQPYVVGTRVVRNVLSGY